MTIFLPHTQSWCKALRIQKEIAALRRLSIEVSNASNEWKEYFEVSVQYTDMSHDCCVGV